MTNKRILICALTSVFGTFAGVAHAAPSGGAYVSDVQQTWVQDRVGDRISTVNMIMCIMSSMRPEAMVNKGPYIALVSQEKCKGQSDASNASTSNSGEANATNYMSAVVDSSQPTETDPLVMKAWISDEDDHGGGSQKTTIYVYLEATAGKSDTNPNGLFKMYYCGVPTDSPTSGCVMKGTLQSDTSGLTFYEAEQGGGGGSQETRLKMQADGTGDNGDGKIQGTDNGTPYSYSFAYDPTYFRRSDNASADICFLRDKAQAHTSTWGYGTYNDDGSHLDLANAGFPVKFVDGSNTYFGYWGFWGLSLPPSAMADVGVTGTLTRNVNGSDETLTVTKKAGKLWKLSRHSGTLDDFKNMSLNYGACQQTTNLPVNGDPPCTNYTLQWNGTTLQAIGKNVCDNNGCNPQTFGTPIDLSAAEFAAVGMNSVNVYSPSGDGVIRVGQTPFSGTTEVFYRTRSLVTPGSADAPTQLLCTNNCPAPYVNTTPLAPWLDITALPWGGGAPASVHSDQNWGPVPIANALGYTYDGMLKRSGTAIDYSAATQSQMGNFQGGLQSGFMIDPNDATALASVKCDNNGQANTGGTNYCPWLASQATTSYQWETGPNQWNQFFGASGSSGAIVFDPPKNLSFTVAADGSNIHAEDASKYAGATLQLQFSGFGQLQGIPGSCVDGDTNLPVPCGPNVRFVPAFDIVDGSSVTDGSHTYWLKYLQREMRLGKAQGADDTACKSTLALTTAASLVLPDVSAVDVDPLTKNGDAPTPASSVPAVIQGVLQN